jgi:hypothetical protein
MKFLAIEKEVDGVDWSNSNEILKEEARVAADLYLKGMIREIYFNDSQCAVILLESRSKETAIEVLNELPLVKAEMITFEITELKPYTGFSRLFEK